MKYPCNCDDMRWMVDNNKVFKKSDGRWMLTWLELDKTSKKGINIENFGITMYYCMFCGNKIVDLGK